MTNTCTFSGTCASLLSVKLSMKIIPLTKGYETIVDDEDYQYLSGFKWRINGRYAVKGKKGYRMHRILMDDPVGMCVDHINRNTMDNRKCNLRVCSKAENSRNCKLRKDGKSKYRGVSLYRDKKWRVQIKYNGKVIHIGYFDKESDAAKAYDKEAIELHGEFCSTNFPQAV